MGSDFVLRRHFQTLTKHHFELSTAQHFLALAIGLIFLTSRDSSHHDFYCTFAVVEMQLARLPVFSRRLSEVVGISFGVESVGITTKYLTTAYIYYIILIYD